MAFQSASYNHLIGDIIGALTLGASIIGYMMTTRKADRREAEEGRQRYQTEQERRHTENAAKLDKIINRQKYLPSHLHREKSGPLCAENIHMPEDD